ncbi:MAG: methylenetetrahydrofolate reductase [NAD(P)H] [Nitrospinaceae bacterium]|nr:MAG: methylenetetrahydrofolate reductase [NAD(P)H] [Nitrospinaceae bacterium]
MKIRDILGRGEPTFSFEFFPPKSEEGFEQLFNTIENLKELKPGYVSVTYGAGGTTRSRTLELVRRIKDGIGLEAMAHLTCVGHDKEEIRDILSRMEEAGIDNVLALRGDPPQGETHFIKTAGGFEYADQLVAFIRRNFSFCLGVAGYPEGHVECLDKTQDLINLKRKVDAGADFIVTQLFFDNRFYYEFMDKIHAMGIHVPVIPGIMPIINVKQIKRFTKMCGATIPRALNNALEEVQDDSEAVGRVGIEYALGQCRDLLWQGAPGVHFYTLNRSPATRAIVEQLTCTE